MQDATHKKPAFTTQHALACAAVLAAALPLAGCRGGEDPPAAVATPTPSPGSARITFASDTHDFGLMLESEARSASFAFTNTGGGPLEVRDIKTSCGCTAASLAKRRFEPGESGTIDVVFDPTGSGQQRKTVTVVTNAEPEGVSRLTITAQVQPFLNFSPRLLRLGVLPYGREHRATMDVTSTDPTFEILNLRTTSPHVRAEVVAAPDGGAAPSTTRTIQVIVPADAPWGGLYCGLDVTARARPIPGAEPVTYTTSVRFAAQLFGALSADPDMFRFGIEPGGAVERTVDLRHRQGSPFRVLGATVTCPQLPGAAVALEQVAADHWRLTLRATAGANPTQCRGAVTISTDVPGEQTIGVGILGVVRASRPGG